MPPFVSVARPSIRLRSSSLADLRRRIGAIERPVFTAAATARTLPVGIEAIDARLPGGGLPLGCLHEIIGRDAGAGAGFCAALLGKLVACRGGVVLWCVHLASVHEAGGLYAPGLAAGGLNPERLIVVRAAKAIDVLWAMEEGLRGDRLAAVLGEVRKIDLRASRRLQLAAEASGTSAFLLRPSSAEEGSPPTASVTRWRLAAAPAPVGPFSPFDRTRWRAELLRCRGGRPGGAWVLEWDHETGDLGLAADLRDRPVVPSDALMAI